MTVKELINQLSLIENQDAEISLKGNIVDTEDDEQDMLFDDVEVWEDGEDTVTVFMFKKEPKYTENISREDIINVGYDIGIRPTKTRIKYVLEHYDSELKRDPDATWNLIVENLLNECKYEKNI